MIIELTANLSATVAGGRYTIQLLECPIVNETPKTYVIKKRSYQERINKTQLLQVTADFSNITMHRLQMRVIAHQDTYDEAMKILTDTLKEKIEALKQLNQFAEDAFNEGPDLVKN